MLTANGEHSKRWLLRYSISSMPFSCCAASPTSERSFCTPFAFKDYQDYCPSIGTQVVTIPLASRLSITHTGGWERSQGEETRPAEISPWIHYSPLSLIKRTLLFECNICFISVVQDQVLVRCLFSYATARWQSHLAVAGWTEWAERLLFVKSDRKQRRCQCVEEFQRRFFL